MLNNPTDLVNITINTKLLTSNVDYLFFDI